MTCTHDHNCYCAICTPGIEDAADPRKAAADAMAKALAKMVGHLRNFYDSTEDSSNPIMKAAGKDLKEATAALAAYNALK